jgi:hypothetical protein
MELKMSNKIMTKYEEEIKSIRSASGINIISVEEVDDNEVFLKLKESFYPFFTVYSMVEIPLQFEASDIYTIVEFKKGAKMKVHNCLYFQFLDGSHLRFSPHGKDGLEISRVMVNPNNMGEGIGTRLMVLFFDFVGTILGEIPPVYLECTGSVGLGENNQTRSISDQTGFFRKFGFKVQNRKHYPDFVSMARAREVINLEVENHSSQNP